MPIVPLAFALDHPEVRRIWRANDALAVHRFAIVESLEFPVDAALLVARLPPPNDADWNGVDPRALGLLDPSRMWASDPQTRALTPSPAILMTFAELSLSVPTSIAVHAVEAIGEEDRDDEGVDPTEARSIAWVFDALPTKPLGRDASMTTRDHGQVLYYQRGFVDAWRWFHVGRTAMREALGDPFERAMFHLGVRARIGALPSTLDWDAARLR